MRIGEHRKNSRRGQAMIEFMLVIVLFMVTLMGTFEVCRLLLSFTTLAHASRVGIRYATTHGSENTEDYQTNADQIEQIVLDFTAGTLIDTSKVTVTTTWPNSTEPGEPGDEVRVQVELAYEPFILLPMSTTLATQTEGIVTF